MQREIWTPIRPDGTLDEAESARPTAAAKPTAWEVVLPARNTEWRFAILHAVASLSLLRPQDTFRVVLPVGFELRLDIFEHCPNVTIAVGPIRTQAEADVVLPDLIAVKAMRREALFAPTEAIMLGSILYTIVCKTCGNAGLATPQECSAHIAGAFRLDIHTVRVRGGDTPMHPAHVRALRDQAAALGVPFSLAWGEWAPTAPACGVALTDMALFNKQENGDVPVYLRDLAEDRRANWAEWQGPADVFMYRLGAERSGCSLDGKPHPEDS